MKTLIFAVLAAIGIAASMIARAADPRNPDWPCNQIKVPELSAAAFWSGPSIEDANAAWEKYSTVRDLAPRIAARRMPLEEAEEAINTFVTGTEVERKSKGTLLFAGLFATLNHERSQVIDGIERFSRRQQEMRDKIRSKLTELRRAQDAPDRDPAAIDKLGEQVAWETRVFDERRQTIGFVCEVPAAIEQRLFLLARTIEQAMQRSRRSPARN